MGRTHRTLHKVLVGEISGIRFVAPLTSEGSNASVYFIGGFILPFLLGLALLEVFVLDLGHPTVLLLGGIFLVQFGSDLTLNVLRILG
jgi:hypothetical protein